MYKKIILLTILLVSLLAISAVSAEDNTVEDNVSADDLNNNVDRILEDESDSDLSDDEIIKLNTKSFYDLYNIINRGYSSEICLEDNYTYNSDYGFENGININRTVTIYSKGNVIIDGNNAAKFFTIDAANVVIKNIIFKNGLTSDEGVLTCCGVNGTVINCKFDNCSAKSGGGAIYWNADNGSITNCAFNNCSAPDGGAIKWYKDNDKFSVNGLVSNCNFTNCHGTYGGGVCWFGDEGSLINCNFNNCYSTGIAGAIYWTGELGCVSESTFTQCFSNYYAGSIYWLGSDGKVSVCKFDDCSCEGDGGAIYWYAPNCIISNSNFTKCSAVENGGAICWNDVQNGNVIHCIFDDCFAKNGGAAYKINATDSKFINNKATEYGGALYISAEDNNIFTNNKASVEGDDNYIPQLILYISNYTSTYGGQLPIILIENNQLAYNIPIIIKIYQNNELIDIYKAYSGYYWNVPLDSGEYIGEFALEDSEGVNPVYATLTILKIPTLISVQAVSSTYNGNGYVLVTLVDDSMNPISDATISVDVTGMKPSKTDKNGQVKFSTNGLVPKTYAAKVTYIGNTNYDKQTTSVNFKINKAIPKLTAAKKTFKKSVKTKKYTVTLKTNQNKVMKNNYITLKVNKKTYKVKTNSKGQATFKITNLNKKGTYTAVVNYAGSKYYNAKTVKPKIIVK